MLYSAEWVLPVCSAPIRNGAVLVRNGRIEWVGSRTEFGGSVSKAGAISTCAADACVIEEELGHSALVPGLVNVHTHLELTVLRGFLEQFAFGDWLHTLHAARRDMLTYDDLVDSSLLGIAEGLLHGMTTMADTTESGAPFDAMRLMGVRGIAYLEVFGPDPRQSVGAIRSLSERVEKLRKDETELVRVGVSPHAPYTVSPELFRSTADLARSEGYPIAVHIAESRAETQYVRDGNGPFAERLQERGIRVASSAQSPVELLARCGVLDARALLVHAIQVDDADLRLIRESGSSIAHCPISNAKLGHGIAPVDRMLSHGIPVGLGSDSVASNDRMHILEEARQAALLHSLRSGVPDSLSAADALGMATLGGATALGLEQSVGTLQPGKAADIAAFPLSHTWGAPVYDPAVALIHVLGGQAVASLTVVDGVVLQRHGQLTGAAMKMIEASEARNRQAADRLVEWRDSSQAC